MNLKSLVLNSYLGKNFNKWRETTHPCVRQHGWDRSTEDPVSKKSQRQKLRGSER